MFKDDVIGWLHSAGIAFESGVRYTGASGTSHLFDFRLPATHNRPERVIQTLSKPDRIHIQSFTYEAIDIRASLNVASPEFFLLYKEDNEPSSRNRSTLLKNKIDPWSWDERAELALKLAG